MCHLLLSEVFNSLFVFEGRNPASLSGLRGFTSPVR